MRLADICTIMAAMPSDADLKRLHWRAHHRGTREADMLIGGFFDAHHALGCAGARAVRRRCSTSRTSTSWPGRIGTAEPPERFAGPMIEALKKLDYIRIARMTEPLQRVLRANEPLTLAGVPSGFLPWLAADLARAAHGIGQGGRAVVIAADEAAMRALADTVPLFAPEVEVLTLPGLGLPALRPRLPGPAGHGRAAGDAERAAGEARQAATAGRHRQCGDAAAADAVPDPPADAPHRRGRADRARGAGRSS